MANEKVVLVWRCKTKDGWRRYPAVYGANGKIRMGVVMAGQPPEERRCPEGRFELRYYEGAKLVQKDVGPDSKKALDAKRVQENLLRAIMTASRAGVEIVRDRDSHRERRTLAKAAAAFLRETEDRGSMEAADVYRLALEEFFPVTQKTFVDELAIEDLSAYMRSLREAGKADRTIYNRWANTKAFYLYCGFDPKKIPREDGRSAKLVAPKYEEKTVQVYEPDEMRDLFQTIQRDPGFYTACRIMLNCGLRDREMRYLEWPQVNLSRGVLHVAANPRYGFKVKDHEERDIPIHKDLLEWLIRYRRLHPEHRLVAPTRSGKPNTKYLNALKSAANRAQRSCGYCDTCLSKNECERWYLHKFRATCITNWLRSPAIGGAGMDLRTAMKYSGHADLASVMRYLSPADNESVRASINGISAGD